MATNDNTQVNSFVKGMNSDVSYSMLQDGQYTFAKNIRITQMNKIGDGLLTNGQGDIRPIEGVEVHGTAITPKSILATGSIRDIGVIIYVDSKDNTWKVGVFKNGSPEDIFVIFQSEEEAQVEKFSIVLHHEIEDLDKLYVADGVNPIKLIPIKQVEGDFIGVDKEEVESYPKVLLNPPHFSGLVDGQLKAGMVQYAYRLYKQYGISTDVSPTTNLIPIVNHETLRGYNQGRTTNSGVELFMEMNKKYNFLDRIQIFRVHYEENGQLPIISIVYDDTISKLIFPDSTLSRQTDPNGRVYYITFIDEGRTELGQISLEEFNSMLGQRIIPKVIESKNDYMFAAQIKDVQSDVFKGVTAESLGIKVKQVTLDLVGDASPLYKINGKPVIRHNTIKRSTDIPTWDFKLRYFMEDGQLDGQLFKDQVLSNITQNYTYSNPAVSYYLKSLRRGETYRYGIVLYDERGNSSGVIPFENDIVAGYEGNSSINQAFSFSSDYDQELIVHPLGIEFEITGELPENAVSYEIVRCRRTEADTVNISQGVLSRPLRRYRRDDDGSIDSSYPYTPSGFITVQDLAWVSPEHFASDPDYYYEGWPISKFYSNNFEDSNIVQFISPETSYLKDTFLEELQDRDITLHLQRILYCDPGIKNVEPTSVHENGWISLSANNTSIPIFYNPVDQNGDYNGPKYTIDNWKYPYSFYKLKYTSVYDRKQWQYIPPSENTIKYENESIQDSMNKDSYSRITNDGDYLSIKQIKQQAYSYIKLYSSIGIPNNVSKDYQVEGSALANELQWNDIFEDNNSQIVNKYEDFLQTIGTNQFNNVVIGGLYGADIYRHSGNGATKENPAIKTTARNLFEPRNDDYVFTASGGRCALLNLTKPLDKYNSGSLTEPRSFYTYLCSIQKNAVPYGKDKKLNTYYSYGSYYKADRKKGIVFDGDTFIQPLEYISMHKTYFPTAWDTVASHMVAYSIPVETSINLAYTTGCELSREYNKGSITNIQIEPADVYSVYGQGKPLYVYNSVYSNNTTAKMFATAEDEDSNAQSHMDYRVMHSNLKSNGEYIDSWLKYQPANYIDVDSKYGEITHLRKFNNKLFFWQDQATGLLSVNERTQITDESNLPLILGNGGVLDRYDYIDDTAGMKKEQYCDTMSDKALYWYDDHNNEIKRAADGSGLMSLTKAYGVQNIMHTYDDNNKPWMFYDKKYNEVVLDLSDTIKQSIVFNENINAFTSIYDVGFDGAVTFKDGIYLLDTYKDEPLLLGKWNEGNVSNFDGKINTYIEYVVNKNPLITKVFDNQEIVSSYLPDIEGPDKAWFSENHTYSWKTDLNAAEDVYYLQMTNREGNYRFAIPRANNAAFGNRIRGKYMICSIEDTAPEVDASISYIITKFRTSWS